MGSGLWALGLGSGVWDHVEVHKTQANKQAFHGKQHSEGERVEAEGLDSSFTYNGLEGLLKLQFQVSYSNSKIW